MEESVTDNELPQSPPKRRRSTFFERRESIVPQSSSMILDQEEKIKNTGSDDKLNQQLRSYHEKLSIEYDQWKKEVKSMRSNYHELKRQYLTAKESRKLTVPYSSLSKEDIEFVQGKYKISKIIESQKKLHESFKVVTAMYERHCDLENVVLNHCTEKVEKIRDYIFENSVME